MSRTYYTKLRKRFVKNTNMEKVLECLKEDIYPKCIGKYNIQGKIVRCRLKKRTQKEVNTYEKNNWNND